MSLAHLPAKRWMSLTAASRQFPEIDDFVMVNVKQVSSPRRATILGSQIHLDLHPQELSLIHI